MAKPPYNPLSNSPISAHSFERFFHKVFYWSLQQLVLHLSVAAVCKQFSVCVHSAHLYSVSLSLSLTVDCMSSKVCVICWCMCELLISVGVVCMICWCLCDLLVFVWVVGFCMSCCLYELLMIVWVVDIWVSSWCLCEFLMFERVCVCVDCWFPAVPTLAF